LIFAVDDRREVYWYHPAWTDAETDPAAIQVASGDAFRELTEAVRHDLRTAKKLRVYALFTESPTSVRAVERQMEDSRAPPPGALLVSVVRGRSH
jgi:hypothetical protein